MLRMSTAIYLFRRLGNPLLELLLPRVRPYGFGLTSCTPTNL